MAVVRQQGKSGRFDDADHGVGKSRLGIQELGVHVLNIDEEVLSLRKVLVVVVETAGGIMSRSALDDGTIAKVFVRRLLVVDVFLVEVPDPSAELDGVIGREAPGLLHHFGAGGEGLVGGVAANTANTANSGGGDSLLGGKQRALLLLSGHGPGGRKLGGRGRTEGNADPEGYGHGGRYDDQEDPHVDGISRRRRGGGAAATSAAARGGGG
mmetsp:Transcript_22128/g.45814  ORF Transcript_22128/g.45814 Transcript_22128/m.45814 type:complete len:211 (-) Transcript_22128:302-934(-)